MSAVLSDRGLPPRPEPPLVVDLDGTLIRSDLLHESALQLLRQAPWALLQMPLWLLRGKAVLKHRIAERTAIDAAALPYDEAFLGWLREQRAAGRRLVLCTASDQRLAQQVATHVGLFDEVMASDGRLNLAGQAKAAALIERFGRGGFDYAGNSGADLSVWPAARSAVVVNASPAVAAAAARTDTPVERTFEPPRVGLATWLRAIRVHQWLKNLLVLLPMAGAFQLADLAAWRAGLLAFLAFSLCASSVYLLNDLMDLDSDRAHPRKRLRPFAAGLLAPLAGLGLSLVLLLAALALSMLLPRAFAAVLGLYFALTLAYTFFLKRKVLIDCLVLGILYTLRIVAGWSAVGLPSSFWLLAFSLFLFVSLAFLKRFSELTLAAQLGKAEAGGRGYLASDLPIVLAMGVASGFASVLLLALYINTDVAMRRYSYPEVLWVTLPIMLYWVSRMWMQAQRGNMHDDPVLFALRDRVSLACAALFGLTLWLAR